MNQSRDRLRVSTAGTVVTLAALVAAWWYFRGPTVGGDHHHPLGREGVQGGDEFSEEDRQLASSGAQPDRELLSSGESNGGRSAAKVSALGGDCLEGIDTATMNKLGLDRSAEVEFLVRQMHSSTPNVSKILAFVVSTMSTAVRIPEGSDNARSVSPGAASSAWIAYRTSAGSMARAFVVHVESISTETCYFNITVDTSSYPLSPARSIFRAMVSRGRGTGSSLAKEADDQIEIRCELLFDEEPVDRSDRRVVVTGTRWRLEFYTEQPGAEEGVGIVSGGLLEASAAGSIDSIIDLTMERVRSSD